MNYIICRALKAAGLPSIQELVGLNREEGKRSDGISILPFSQGRALCWDVTCMNTFAKSSINDSAIEAGLAAAKTENTKRTKYPDLLRRYRFEPIAIETSGVYGPITRNIVHEIGKRISKKSGDKRETL